MSSFLLHALVTESLLDSNLDIVLDGNEIKIMPKVNEKRFDIHILPLIG